MPLFVVVAESFKTFTSFHLKYHHLRQCPWFMSYFGTQSILRWDVFYVLHSSFHANHLFLRLCEWCHHARESVCYRKCVRDGKTNKPCEHNPGVTIVTKRLCRAYQVLISRFFLSIFLSSINFGVCVCVCGFVLSSILLSVCLSLSINPCIFLSVWLWVPKTSSEVLQNTHWMSSSWSPDNRQFTSTFHSFIHSFTLKAKWTQKRTKRPTQTLRTDINTWIHRTEMVL